jgi:hypothetical protein
VARHVAVETAVHHDGRRVEIPPPPGPGAPDTVGPAGTGDATDARHASGGARPLSGAAVPRGETRRAALGALAGARSGDKGGNANVGLWVRTPGAYDWLAAELTVDRLRQLLPEAADLAVERYELPNLLALNFVVHGLLGEGVASSTRPDPQAKSLGEYLRSRLVDVPVALLDEAVPRDDAPATPAPPVAAPAETTR